MGELYFEFWTWIPIIQQVIRWQLWEVISLGTFNPPPPPEFSQVNPALVPTQAGQRGAIANQDCSSSIMATAWEVEKRWFQKGWHRTGMIRYGVIKFVASEPTPPLMYPHIRFNKVLLRETSHDKLHIFGEHQSELTHRTQYILDLNISSFEF